MNFQERCDHAAFELVHDYCFHLSPNWVISLREEANKKGKGRLIKTVVVESNGPKISLIEEDFFLFCVALLKVFGIAGTFHQSWKRKIHMVQPVEWK